MGRRRTETGRDLPEAASPVILQAPLKQSSPIAGWSCTRKGQFTPGKPILRKRFTDKSKVMMEEQLIAVLCCDQTPRNEKESLPVQFRKPEKGKNYQKRMTDGSLDAKQQH